MKRIPFFLIAAFSILILFNSCGNTDYSSSEASLSETTTEPSADATYNEEARAIIKTANIALEVDQLEQSIIDLKKALVPINGYVYNYEINNNSYTEDSYQKNMDSMVTVEKIVPRSNLSVRIPIAYADSFINYILNADAEIASLKISDEDVTENVWEKNQVAQVYDNSGTAQKHKGNAKNISYDNNTSIDAIKAKATAAKMNYQTKYLWFDISMNAQPLIKTKTSLAIKNYRTPMHIALANAVITGWHICEDILLGLITIWPVLILLGLVYFLVKKFRVKAA
jgi:hypothetical protein